MEIFSVVQHYKYELILVNFLYTKHLVNNFAFMSYSFIVLPNSNIGIKK